MLLDLPHISAITELPVATALLLDLDGTLAPLDPDPLNVRIIPEVRERLQRCIDVLPVVAIITGRGRSVAHSIVDMDGLWFATCHGMEIEDPVGNHCVDPVAAAARPQLDIAAQMAHTVGWAFEDKGLTMTIHYRHDATPELTAQQMRLQMETVLDPLVIEIRQARMSLELLPRNAQNKGSAVDHILAANPQLAAVVAVGDDRTDADMFGAAAASPLNSYCIAVHNSETDSSLFDAATHVISEQAEVAQLLDLVLELQAGGH